MKKEQGGGETYVWFRLIKLCPPKGIPRTTTDGRLTLIGRVALMVAHKVKSTGPIGMFWRETRAWFCRADWGWRRVRVGRLPAIAELSRAQVERKAKKRMMQKIVRPKERMRWVAVGMGQCKGRRRVRM